MKDQGSIASLIGEDRAFQEAYWSFQRGAWALFALLIAVALLGGAGGAGPFARQTIQAGSAVIDAPRVMRWASNDRISIRQAVAQRESIEIVLSPAFNDALQLDTISPQPFQSAMTRAGSSYWFFLEPGARSDIVFDVKPLKPTLRFTGTVTVGQAPPVPLTFTILP